MSEGKGGKKKGGRKGWNYGGDCGDRYLIVTRLKKGRKRKIGGTEILECV